MDGDRQRDATDALGQIAFVVMGVLTRVAADHDISLTQLRVLGILRDRTPQMSQLAAYLGLERSTLSGLVGRAELRGLVSRRPSTEDARASLVEMTATGHRLAGIVERDVAAALADLVGQLDDRQVTALRQVATLASPAMPSLAATPTNAS